VRDALRSSPAPVVAVSPIVDKEIVKGPTAAFMRWRGNPLTSDGIVAEYDGLLDGLIADQPAGSLPVLETDVLMNSAGPRRRLAEQTLHFALGLA
jgi:LPPG:FO 2-phospho-L-lactate transferase